MTTSLAKDLGRRLIWLLWIGAAAGVVVQGLYIYNFGPGQWFKLSPNPDHWGVFGDYVGGLLNPIFSFLAFVGVLLTVVLQARQLDAAREQSNHEELQRLLATVAETIDAKLGKVCKTPG
jgi:uncharacterized membrane protein